MQHQKVIKVPLSQTKTLKKFANAMNGNYAVELGDSLYFILSSEFDTETDILHWKVEKTYWGEL